MQRFLTSFAVLAAILHYGTAYSKYGRTCKDIGCLSSEVCVMAEDPCSYYNRDQCGSYPTCKSDGQHNAPSCAKFVCPPTQTCQMDNGTPKCVAGNSATATRVSQQNQDGQNVPGQPSAPLYPGLQPNYPSYPQQPYPQGGGGGGSLYPQLPGQTTPRPALMNPAYPQGNGYRGGAVGSGYPGQGSQYPGYPSQGGYPNQQGGQYPGYPNQQGGQQYPGYQGGQQYPGYNGQYPGYSGQGRYPATNNQGYRPPAKSEGNPLVDKITDQLKTIGVSLFKNALGIKT